LRPLWLMEEMGLSYDLITLPFPPRVFQKDYLGINPLGTVPYFIEGDVRMTESSAICHFLVERHGHATGHESLGLRVEDPLYGRYLNWMYFSDATLTFPQTIVLRYTQLEPPDRRLPQAVEDYSKWFLGRLRAVDAALQGQNYLCAGRFTAADITVGYALVLAKSLGLDASFPPAVGAYLQRLEARPAYQRAAAR
jgi:glutathione S-transferase